MNAPFRPLNALPPSVGYPFQREFDACKRLLHLIKNEILEGRHELPRQVDLVIDLETVKAVNTFEAILHLSLDGFGMQAEMLLRPMFEAVVTSAWAQRHPDEVEERYPLHRDFLLDLWARARRESGLYQDIGAPVPLGPEDQARAIGWFGQFGQRNWTGHTFREMAQEFVESSERHDAFHLANYLKLVHPFVNWMLHSSGLNFYRLIAVEEGGPTATIGPSQVAIRDAMDMGWNLAVLAVGIFADHFALDAGDRFARSAFDVWAAFKDPAVMKHLGRNDPCPCKSGLKFKICHGELNK